MCVTLVGEIRHYKNDCYYYYYDIKNLTSNTVCVCTVCMILCVCVCCSYGYPDPDYLIRVEGELAVKGVTDADLTDKQQDFIQNPKKYIKHSYWDFSHCFK